MNDHVDFAFLADGAEAINGKLYVMGGAFDTIWTNAVPLTYPKISFAMRLIFSSAELERKHKLEISVINEDGKPITAIVGGDLEISRNPNVPKGWKHGFLTVINLANLKFPDFGDYSFEVVLNNSSVKSVGLRVARSVQFQS